MKRFLLTVLTFVVLVGCFGCKQEEKTIDTSSNETVEESTQNSENSEQADFETITQEEAKELIETDEAPVVLDVRSFEEYESGHIENAICFPVDSLSETITMLLPNKQQLVLIYADTKEKSKLGAEKMVELGYTNVKDFGEFKDWDYALEK